MTRPIFVSYTMRDGYLTKRSLEVAQQLMTGVVPLYIDLLDNKLQGPEEFQVHLDHTLMTCAVLYAWRTPGYLESPWVLRELGLAVTLNIPVIFGPWAADENTDFQQSFDCLVEIARRLDHSPAVGDAGGFATLSARPRFRHARVHARNAVEAQ